jgi:hypothetical protein
VCCLRERVHLLLLQQSLNNRLLRSTKSASEPQHINKPVKTMTSQS